MTNAPNNSRLATNILGLDDTQADHQFRPNFYKGDSLWLLLKLLAESTIASSMGLTETTNSD
ncbi:MAG: hypothetical protein EAZ59_24470 [Oscillatoriales cyanobacterium]|nr:MAG: hypothetical protein EAZ59_24470 [Oscillatoriales cyanobacterium]